MTDTTADLLHQPVSDIQLKQLIIEWVPRDSIRSNSYNPNRMGWHERQLLLQSLLEDGWTQPIVTLMDRTIVDGEQRWTTAGLEVKPSYVQEIIDKMEDRKAKGYPESDSIINRLKESKVRLEAAISQGIPPTVAAITGGLVPITRVDFGDDAHKMISTIRHNRARGSHQIDAMASITQDLVQLGLDFGDLEKRLGMDDEEIRRFMQSAEGQMKDFASNLDKAFSPSMQVKNLAEFSDAETSRNMQTSTAYNASAKAYQEELANRERALQQARKAEVDRIEAASGKTLTQDEKAKIAKEVEATIAAPPKPAPPSLKRFQVMVTPEEFRLVSMITGDAWAVGLIAMVEVCLDHPEILQEIQQRIQDKQGGV